MEHGVFQMWLEQYSLYLWWGLWITYLCSSCAAAAFPPCDLSIFVWHKPCQVPWQILATVNLLIASCDKLQEEEEFSLFLGAAILTGVHKCWISALINPGMSLNLWIPPKGEGKRHTKKGQIKCPHGRREENKQLLNLLVKGRYFPLDS